MKINIQFSSKEMATVNSFLNHSQVKELENGEINKVACKATWLSDSEGNWQFVSTLNEDMVCEYTMILKSLYHIVLGLIESVKSLYKPFYEKWFNNAEDKFNDIIDSVSQEKSQEELLCEINSFLISEKIKELSNEQVKELNNILNDFNNNFISIRFLEDLDVNNINEANVSEIVNILKNIKSNTIKQKFNKKFKGLEIRIGF